MGLAESNLAQEDGCFIGLVCGFRTPNRRSFANGLQKTPVFLAHFTRFLKRTSTLLIKAPKVALNVPNVEFKVAPDKFGVVSSRLGVAWNIWPRWGQTGFGGCTSGQNHQQNYSLRTAGAVQPKGAQTP